MSEKNEITVDMIENALLAAGSTFTLASVAKALGAGRSDVVRRRLERAVDRDDRFLHDDKWNCATRDGFFTGRKFVITPDEWEIAEGVLFPGHRFVPFLPESVFPSDVKMVCGGEAAARREVILPLGKVFHYHLLLGSEQVFDYMIADNSANAHLANHASASDSVTLTVFDMADFYKKNGFVFGDALLCEVSDYQNGEVIFSCLPGSERAGKARRERIDALDMAVKKVWELYGEYLDIPEQLARAEFFIKSGNDSAGASVDEFIAGSNMVELRADGDHAVLTIRDENNSGNISDIELPEGLSISKADLSDPEKLLSGAGFPLTAAEVDSFMLDAIYGRESDFDGVYSRIFGHRELDLADEAQQVTLLNYLEEKFEELSANYNRVDDEAKAPLRSQLVEAVSERLEFIAALGALDRDVNDEEKAKLEKLAAISAKSSELLKLLNNPAFTPDETELDRLTAMSEELFDQQDELLRQE